MIPIYFLYKYTFSLFPAAKKQTCSNISVNYRNASGYFSIK